MKKLFIKTYGCQMNFYDSDHMSNLLNGHGYETSQDIKAVSYTHLTLPTKDSV